MGLVRNYAQIVQNVKEMAGLPKGWKFKVSRYFTAQRELPRHLQWVLN